MGFTVHLYLYVRDPVPPVPVSTHMHGDMVHMVQYPITTHSQCQSLVPVPSRPVSSTIHSFSTKLLRDMSILKFSFAIFAIAVVNGASEEATFENVTVYGPTSIVFLISANNLNENPSCQQMSYIRDIDGPSFTVLRKNSVTDLPKLESFSKDEGNLAHIEPGAFKNLPNLKGIDITWNPLKEVEEGVFNDLPIESLVLSYNKILRIAPRAFDNMTNLQEIALRYNKISQWDSNWFRNTPKLLKVEFGFHFFQELPDRAFESFKDKKGVTLLFSVGLDSLKRVGDDLFAGAKEVGSLDLSYNGIKSFGESVLNGVETMDWLHLTGNKIECFSGNFDRIFVARLTYITNNPLICDKNCSNIIRNWQQSKGTDHKVVHGFTELYCP